MRFINIKAPILILDWDEKVWKWIKLLLWKCKRSIIWKKKVTEKVTFETAKIINEKEIPLIKFLEHILITLCQLRDIQGVGSRDVVK